MKHAHIKAFAATALGGALGVALGLASVPKASAYTEKEPPPALVHVFQSKAFAGSESAMQPYCPETFRVFLTETWAPHDKTKPLSETQVMLANMLCAVEYGHKRGLPPALTEEAWAGMYRIIPQIRGDAFVAPHLAKGGYSLSHVAPFGLRLNIK